MLQYQHNMAVGKNWKHIGHFSIYPARFLQMEYFNKKIKSDFLFL